MREALEDLKTPVRGHAEDLQQAVLSKTNHEALTAKDFVWIHWKDGKLLPYTRRRRSSRSTAADFKQ